MSAQHILKFRVCDRMCMVCMNYSCSLSHYRGLQVGYHLQNAKYVTDKLNQHCSKLALFPKKFVVDNNATIVLIYLHFLFCILQVTTNLQLRSFPSPL